MKKLLAFAFVLLLVSAVYAADNLQLNPKLDYNSDSQDGPLITGDHMQDGVAAGKPNYVFMYGEGCYNSKRQARRTVSLYEKYKDRVNFVVIDLDKHMSGDQIKLRERFYRGYIPHVVVLDRDGKVLYDKSGEHDEADFARMFEQALK